MPSCRFNRRAATTSPTTAISSCPRNRTSQARGLEGRFSQPGAKPRVSVQKTSRPCRGRSSLPSRSTTHAPPAMPATGLRPRRVDPTWNPARPPSCMRPEPTVEPNSHNAARTGHLQGAHILTFTQKTKRRLRMVPVRGGRLHRSVAGIPPHEKMADSPCSKFFTARDRGSHETGSKTLVSTVESWHRRCHWAI